jgi:hypothetical protein
MLEGFVAVWQYIILATSEMRRGNQVKIPFSLLKHFVSEIGLIETAFTKL